MKPLPMNNQPDVDFVVRLRPIKTGWLTPPAQRLRLALKCLGRGFGLRTVEVKPVPAPQPEPAQP